MLGTTASGATTAMLVVALTAGCGTTSALVSDEVSSVVPYDGPMLLDQDFSDDATPRQRSGAAGRALECDGAAYDGGAGDYVDGGLESAQSSAEQALQNWLDNQSWGLPTSGYRVEREDSDRVLLSYDVDERTRIAFIAANGIGDYNGETGWGIESWAQCDPAELPASVTEPLGIEVWEDSSGARVPVTQIRSFAGAEHCDWQDITFLILGQDEDGRGDRSDDADEFLRDTTGELADYLRTTYDATASLPKRAVDTGFSRDGRRLWLDPNGDAAYLVSTDDPDDVERWPASEEPIRCA
jgi:hypothetical protein